MGIEEKVKLYVRLPVKLEEESQIKDLHPDILAVHLPRQKSRRWCFIDLANQETLEKVAKDLKKVKVNNKKLFVGTYKKKIGHKEEKLQETEEKEDLLKSIKKH